MGRAKISFEVVFLTTELNLPHGLRPSAASCALTHLLNNRRATNRSTRSPTWPASTHTPANLPKFANEPEYYTTSCVLQLYLH
jgi:hypothetical protein